MKLKYYLRGLGIGIVVTAIIMSFTKKPEELTDAQIKIRAAQLGMVEESVLADIPQTDKASAEDNKDNLSDIKQESENTEETIVNPEKDAENIEEVVDNAEQDAENAEEVVDNAEQSAENAEEVVDNAEQSAENAEEVVDNAEQGAENISETVNDLEQDDVSNNEQVESYIVISIKSGNGSEIVSQRLYEAGLVNSPAEYNKFLVKNGYDRRLRVGNHEIPVGAMEEEMAKILCGMK